MCRQLSLSCSRKALLAGALWPQFRAGLRGCGATPVDVAVGDRHVEVVVLAVALSEVLGDRDRAVATAGAADRDHQVRLALGDVLRQQEVEQRSSRP